jgi:hypothetical protein
VGPRTVVDAEVKGNIPSPLRESNPRTPVRSGFGLCSKSLQKLVKLTLIPTIEIPSYAIMYTYFNFCSNLCCLATRLVPDVHVIFVCVCRFPESLSIEHYSILKRIIIFCLSIHGNCLTLMISRRHFQISGLSV